MTDPTQGATLTIPVGDGDNVAGPESAPVTIVEYGDFQCPSCGDAEPEIQAVRAELGDRLRYAFRHFPLTTMHEFAEGAAEASEAAAAHGKFWEMHDALFANQEHLEPARLGEYAAEIGLDAGEVTRAVTDQTYAPKVRADFRVGVSSGVNGTPTFFINGARHDGSYDRDTLLEAARAAMA
ncbi:MAG: DsbA family protein [Thermomicrobiales bacterium]